MMSDDLDLRLPHLHAFGRKKNSDSFPTTTSTNPVPDFTDDENEFILAVARLRDVNKIKSPTLCQLLWVAKKLGYQKIQPPRQNADEVGA
jgi:hypothetical protein